MYLFDKTATDLLRNLLHSDTPPPLSAFQQNEPSSCDVGKFVVMDPIRFRAEGVVSRSERLPASRSVSTCSRGHLLHLPPLQRPATKVDCQSGDTSD